MGKLTHVLWACLSKHKLEITAMLGFVIFAVPWMVPPRYFEFYELQMRMRLLFGCSGILFIPELFCLLPFYWTQESSVDFQILGIVTSIISIGALGWAVAYIVKRLFVEHWKGKARRWVVVIAVIGFLLNVPCALCTLLMSASLVRSESCTAFFSKTHGIRIVTYTALTFYDISFYDMFFLTTKNNGNDWQQKILLPDDAYGSEATLCRNVTTLDETLVWTWSGNDLFRSDNGGDRWQILRIPSWPGQESGYTRQVSFQDYQHGHLIYEIYGGEPITFLTSDGGKTWHTVKAETQEEQW